MAHVHRKKKDLPAQGPTLSAISSVQKLLVILAQVPLCMRRLANKYV